MANAISPDTVEFISSYVGRDIVGGYLIFRPGVRPVRTFSLPPDENGFFLSVDVDEDKNPVALECTHPGSPVTPEMLSSLPKSTISIGEILIRLESAAIRIATLAEKVSELAALKLGGEIIRDACEDMRSYEAANPTAA